MPPPDSPMPAPTIVDLQRAFAGSQELAAELMELVPKRLLDDTPRLQVAAVACQLSFQHWQATRKLLELGLVPSAIAVHRSQFDALLRAMWATHAASDTEIAKLSSELNSESDQTARSLPGTNPMLAALERSGPRDAFVALDGFKTSSWAALNSYVHAGLHAIHRGREGYPAALGMTVLCNSNALAVMASMLAINLCGRQDLQRSVMAVAAKYATCLPPPAP